MLEWSINIFFSFQVDVWSLACLLFGMLYGSSPFEIEFRGNHDCPVTIVECTQLRILGDLPTPPAHSISAKWYSTEIRAMIVEMLNKDRHQRPTLQTVMNKMEDLIRQKGGTVRIQREEQRRYREQSYNLDVRQNNMNSSTRNFV